MAEDQSGALGPTHVYVTSVEAGYFPGSTLVPVLDALTPASCPVGPPDDVVLVASGSDFAYDACIAFGNWPDGKPRFEHTTHEEDGTLSTVITAGYFPGADPAIPVLVGNAPPNGPVSTVLTFAIEEVP